MNNHCHVVWIGAIACLASQVFGQAASAPATSSPTAVQQELLDYYNNYNKGNNPPWEKALVGLASGTEDQRHKQARYLRELLDQALKDELSETAPWFITPYWGSNGENPARELRKHIAEKLENGDGVPAAMPLYQWFLESEKLSELQPKALKSLLKVNTKEAQQLILSLAEGPHSNSVVVQMALDEIAKRKLEIPQDTLSRLCQHYRLSIRTAARNAAKTLGRPDPPPFDAEAAVRSKAVAKLMADLSEFVLEPAPDNAPFVLVAIHQPKVEPEEDTQVRGWLLKETPVGYVVQTPFGTTSTIAKRHDDARWPLTSKMSRLDISKEVERVAKIRSSGNKNFDLSERDGLTGQFQGHDASLYEVLLAHWLYKTKQYKLAAQVLLPALDTLYLDQHLLDLTRHGLGQVYGYRMLVAFAGNRDYDQTLKMADLISEHFKDTALYQYALDLREEIPKRRDDFKTLKLPTPKEWEDLKRTLNRQQQIQFLCDRVRLLNCFQDGQPGGTDLDDKQYAEPCGMADNASWGGRGGKTKVINPRTALKKLKPTIAEVPIVAGYMREDWHIPTVTFWRDFHPSRTLFRTGPIFRDIVNDACVEEVCNPREAEWQTPQGRQRIVSHVVEWANKHKNDNQIDLHMRLLQRGLETNGPWQKCSWHAQELVTAKQTQAAPLILKCLKFGDQMEIMDLLMKLDVATAHKAALEVLSEKSVRVRIKASIICLQNGSAAEGIKTLDAVFMENRKWEDDFFGEETRELPQAVEALLKQGSPEARSVAAKVLRRDILKRCSDRGEVLRLLSQAREPRVYSFCREMLKDTEDVGFRANNRAVTLGLEFAEAVVENVGKDDAILQQQAKAQEDHPDKYIAVADQWLEKKMKTEGPTTAKAKE